MFPPLVPGRLHESTDEVRWRTGRLHLFRRFAKRRSRWPALGKLRCGCRRRWAGERRLVRGFHKPPDDHEGQQHHVGYQQFLLRRDARLRWLLRRLRRGRQFQYHGRIRRGCCCDRDSREPERHFVLADACRPGEQSFYRPVSNQQRSGGRPLTYRPGAGRRGRGLHDFPGQAAELWGLRRRFWRGLR